jgi:hypothetical protein
MTEFVGEINFESAEHTPSMRKGNGNGSQMPSKEEIIEVARAMLKNQPKLVETHHREMAKFDERKKTAVPGMGEAREPLTESSRSSEAERSERNRIAEFMINPIASSAVTIEALVGIDCVDIGKELGKANREYRAGITDRLENMLFCHAHALQAMFTHCALKMANASNINQAQVYGHLALKAQNLCRNTIVSLSAIKSAPTAEDPSKLKST